MCSNSMSQKLISLFSVWEDVSPIDYFSTGISSLIFFFFNGDSSSNDQWVDYWKVSREYQIIWTQNI